MRAHTHKTSARANRTGGDCPGSSPCRCPAAAAPLLSLTAPGHGKEGFPPALTPAAAEEVIPQRLRMKRTILPGREKTPAFRNPAAGRGRAVRTMNPAAAVPETERPPSERSKGERHPARRCAVRGTHAAGARLRSERREAVAPPARRRGASAERSCQPPSGGSGLRAYTSDRMATSSRSWATLRVTSSAAELPHRCEMRRVRGRAARGGSRLPRQRAASERSSANRLEIC